MSWWNKDLVPKSFGQRQRLNIFDWLFVVFVFVTMAALTYGIAPLFGLSKPETIMAGILVGVLGGLTVGWLWAYPASDTVTSNIGGLLLGLIVGGALLITGLRSGKYSGFSVLVYGVNSGQSWHLKRPYVTGLFLGSAYLAMISLLRLMLLKKLKASVTPR